MGYVTSRHGDLLVAENSVDEEAVTCALKQLDRDLILTREVDRRRGCYVWRVVKWQGGDRPVEPVCWWRNDFGEPLPLSFRLVDKVRSLQVGGTPLSVDRWAGLTETVDEDEHNRRLQERLDRDADAEVMEIYDDLIPRITGKRIPVLHRGVHLRRSRHKPGGRWNTPS